ncbi:hypothetical protein A9P82_01185 [Arachidicoccus ginsenosidimutans]|uniref:hypothetical protein n=1 Tax=Arachidicoccus sp. BS20 TaxID=1850526 RepID=UPI0007F16752|nr:hypothetical protein [Arachidicoccus sp. BS20]ANI88054.1 hypothetical protein A9P82_01185 [Arachidicoccus sp. BS20]
MEKIIIYLPEVRIYFNDLMDVLFKQEYFGFMDSAEEYVLKIKSFIEENIATFPAKNTPVELQQYGEKYLTYKANEHTSWYIFFSQIEQNYFIKFITNNHTSLAAKLNIDY